MPKSRIAGAPTRSGVGAGVGVGGTDAGVGVLVAGVGSGVGVSVGPSSHADSNATANKHSSPTHTIRHEDHTLLTRKVKRQLLAPFLGRSAASELVICHVGTVGHAPAE